MNNAAVTTFLYILIILGSVLLHRLLEVGLHTF